jgi:hypothetical protein
MALKTEKQYLGSWCDVVAHNGIMRTGGHCVFTRDDCASCNRSLRVFRRSTYRQHVACCDQSLRMCRCVVRCKNVSCVAPFVVRSFNNTSQSLRMYERVAHNSTSCATRHCVMRSSFRRSRFYVTHVSMCASFSMRIARQTRNELHHNRVDCSQPMTCCVNAT